MCVRRVDPSVLVFSLSLYRHLYVCCLFYCHSKISVVQSIDHTTWKIPNMCQIHRSVGSRPCRTEMFPPITVRTSVPTTPYPQLRQCSDLCPPHPHQFVMSCPIYVCVYTLIYIRIISFTYNFYIPEHYRCSLMRSLRDTDLHRQTTCRRRHVELPNPTVCTPCTSRPWHIITVPPPHIEPTHFCSLISETTTTETAYII